MCFWRDYPVAQVVFIHFQRCVQKSALFLCGYSKYPLKKKKKRKIKQHSLGGSSLFWLFVFPWHCKCQDRCECQLQELLPVCSSRWVLQCQGSLSAKSNPLTDLILRLWTPSPQAGRSSTVLMVQMDQGSILHSCWLHSRWHRTASYTCTHACANKKGDIRGITEWKKLSVLAWKDKQTSTHTKWIPTQACYKCRGGDCQGHSAWCVSTESFLLYCMFLYIMLWFYTAASLTRFPLWQSGWIFLVK